MFNFFIYFTISKNPLFLFHGITGSSILVTYNNFAKYYYCPKELNRSKIWINSEYLSYPKSNCFLDMLKVEFNSKKEFFSN